MGLSKYFIIGAISPLSRVILIITYFITSLTKFHEPLNRVSGSRLTCGPIHLLFEGVT